jgi:hypothetical protein
MPGWPAKRDSPVSEISLCSYFYSKNHRAFIWTSGLARLPRSRLKEARSRLPGWKFLHINTHKRASPVAGMKVQRYRRKLFLTTVKTIQCNKIVPASGMKFSHINTREIHPAYRAVSLSGPARLPYKQAQIYIMPVLYSSPPSHPPMKVTVNDSEYFQTKTWYRVCHVTIWYKYSNHLRVTSKNIKFILFQFR